MLLSESASFLERAFNTLNLIYFDNSLPYCVITIMTSVKAYGHITVQKTWADSKEKFREINISAEYLNRPIEQLLATLAHEMCHLYAMENGMNDTSKGGKYHNKLFKALCEERDLQISYVQYIGYSKTEPTEKFITTLRENGLYIDCIDSHRLTHFDNDSKDGDVDNGGKDGDSENKGKIGKKSYVRKYICSSCKKSVRATTDVNICCLDCDTVMEKENKQGEE